jgi:hypothetical protein
MADLQTWKKLSAEDHKQVEGTPQGHPDLAGRLNNLGVMLKRAI